MATSLRQFTRAEVSEHASALVWDKETQAHVVPEGSEPYIILHNKVYDITTWLEDHPGGEVILMDKAGLDATADFEDLAHSDFARETREKFLVGEIVESEREEFYKMRTDENKGAGSSGGVSVAKLAVALSAALYVRAALNAKKIPSVTYSAALRHAHLGMGVGLLGGIGFVQMARRTEDTAEKGRLMGLHKSSGVLMLAALALRVVLRMRSVIPNRFAGPALVQAAETASQRAFYALCAALALSGIRMGYFGGKGVPLFGTTIIEGKHEPSEEDFAKAKQSFNTHLMLGKVLEYAFIPLHFGGNAYHWLNGRDVVRKITPFL